MSDYRLLGTSSFLEGQFWWLVGWVGWVGLVGWLVGWLARLEGLHYR